MTTAKIEKRFMFVFGFFTKFSAYYQKNNIPKTDCAYKKLAVNELGIFDCAICLILG